MLLNSKLPLDILMQIEKYANSVPDEETCGIVLKINKEYVFKPCKNISSNRKKAFLMNPYVLLEHGIEYIYHSHVNSSCGPSRFDIVNAKNIKIPFLIYSLRDKEFSVYKCV